MTAAVLVVTGLITEGAAQAGDRVEQVKEAERERFAAMVAPDLEALSAALADDLTYAHSNGTVQDKPALLAALSSGDLDYLSLKPREQDVRLEGRLAVVTGVADVRVVVEGRELSVVLRYTDVYRRSAGRWQLIAWQSTRLPE
jgi:ketosteroid isomerase-like protein